MEFYPQGAYWPRNARASPLYRLVEDHFDELERVWDERYEREHGFWRPVVRPVVEQFLDCGDLRCGFARLRCAACRKELLLPYSCRRGSFCPSCHRKRALLFAEHVDQGVLGDCPVRQYVVTIPKMLRLCFKYDRKLLGELSRCFYDSIKEIFLLAAPHAGASSAASPRLPAMISSVQTYGEDPTRFHPHAHCLAADGLLAPDGSLFPIPEPDPVQIMLRFRRRLLQILLAKERISQRLVEVLLSWRHPGFSVFQGDPVSSDDHEVRERLARYMAHPPVGLNRLHYDPQMRQVTYAPKHHQGGAGPDSPGTITCPALDFLAALCTHIPDAGQQLIRYYGAWSHVRRARARKSGCAAARTAPSPGTQDGCAHSSKRTWARLTKKV